MRLSFFVALIPFISTSIFCGLDFMVIDPAWTKIPRSVLKVYPKEYNIRKDDVAKNIATRVQKKADLNFLLAMSNINEFLL